MAYNNLQMILICISILLVNINSYIIIPLKSTDELYFSKLTKTEITLNDKEKIQEIFLKYINNVLYADLLLGEPNQKAVAFLSKDDYGFSFYEDFQLKN